MKDIEKLAEQFFTNENVCTQQKVLNVGDKCFILDTQLIDPETDFYAIIPVVVVAVDCRPSRFNRIYYWFKAYGSKIDDMLNVNREEENFGGLAFDYYKFLEATSPYILTSIPESD